MNVSALVDDREPAGLIEAVRSHPEVSAVEVTRLSAGDVVLRPPGSDAGGAPSADADAGGGDGRGHGNGDGDDEVTVGVERKTPADYVSSAFGASGSDLYDQTARLSASYDYGYVLVEGTLPEMEAVAVGPGPTAVRGSLASITARRVPVVPCSDRERLVDVAVRLGRKHAEAPGRRPLPAGAVGRRNEPVAKRIYGCIDGIGPTTAQRLHEAFPTVASLVAASVDEITAVEGVGETRARAVRESLHERG